MSDKSGESSSGEEEEEPKKKIVAADADDIFGPSDDEEDEKEEADEEPLEEKPAEEEPPGPPQGHLFAYVPDAEEYSKDQGTTTKSEKTYLYQVGTRGNSVGIMILADFWGFRGGRTRAIADYLAKALNALVVIPRMLDHPAYEGGNDYDGIPADFPLEEKLPSMKGWIMKNTHEFYLGKIVDTVNWLRQRGVKRIGVLGLGWGTWMLTYAAEYLHQEFICGVMLYPQMKWIAEMNNQSAARLMKKVPGPLYIMTSSTDDPDFSPGGELYETNAQKYPEEFEYESFSTMPVGWVITGDLSVNEEHRQATIKAVNLTAGFFRNALWPFAPGYDASALRLVCSRGDIATVNALLQTGVPACGKYSKDIVGQTPMFYAAREGHGEPVRSLLAWSADPNWLGGIGVESALHIMALANKPKTAKILLAGKADPDIRDKGGQAPLHRAARNGAIATVQQLLAHRADIDSRDTSEQMPLHIAIFFAQEDLVKVLLAQRAELDAEDIRGRTPMKVAKLQNLDNIYQELVKEEERREVEAFYTKLASSEAEKRR